eukprot:1693284-Prymnesium_polylepis.1
MSCWAAPCRSRHARAARCSARTPSSACYSRTARAGRRRRPCRASAVRCRGSNRGCRVHTL